MIYIMDDDLLRCIAIGYEVLRRPALTEELRGVIRYNLRIYKREARARGLKWKRV